MTPLDNLIVITGGPGAGKTTLISALAARGFATAPEVGRAIIRHQQAIGGSALPWANAEIFAELMLSWDMRSYEELSAAAKLVFFDRGIPDVIGYLTLIGRPVPMHLRTAAEQCRYRGQVFICPPWREIFTNDRERRQDFGEAERTFDAISQTYATLGYDLIKIPKTGIEQRVAFVLGMSVYASN